MYISAAAGFLDQQQQQHGRAAWCTAAESVCHIARRTVQTLHSHDDWDSCLACGAAVGYR
jgi:hypothetical protein